MRTKRRTISKSKALIGFVLIGAILFATNPIESEFKEYLKEDMIERAEKNNDVSGTLKKMFAEPAAWVMGLTTERTNFYLFSTYTVEVVNETRLYVGVLSFFVRIS